MKEEEDQTEKCQERRVDVDGEAEDESNGKIITLSSSN